MGTHLIFESDFDCLTDSFALSNVFQHRGKGVARGCHLQPRHGQLPDVFGAQAAEVGRRRKRDKQCARPAASTTSQQLVLGQQDSSRGTTRRIWPSWSSRCERSKQTDCSGARANSSPSDTASKNSKSAALSRMTRSAQTSWKRASPPSKISSNPSTWSPSTRSRL